MANTTQELTQPIDAIGAGTDILVSVWEKANQNGWMTLTGLDPDVLTSGSLLPEDEDKIVLFVSGMGDAAAWARGDFSLYVRGKIRERMTNEGWTQTQYNEVWANELDRLSRRFGVSPKTLQNNIATCSIWTHENRVAGQHVRYKHHEAIPSDMEPEEKVAYLRQCEEEGWTWARLYKIVRGDLLPDGSNGTPARGNTLLNGTPVDVQIENSGIHTQDDDELDDLDENGLAGVDQLPPHLEQEIAETTAQELPEGWLTVEPGDEQATDATTAAAAATTTETDIVPAFGVATTAAIAEDTDDNWVSMSWLDGSGGTTILTEANSANQQIHALFSNGSVWRITLDTTLGTVRVEHL